MLRAKLSRERCGMGVASLNRFSKEGLLEKVKFVQT